MYRKGLNPLQQRTPDKVEETVYRKESISQHNVSKSKMFLRMLDRHVGLTSEICRGWVNDVGRRTFYGTRVSYSEYLQLLLLYY